MKKSFKIEVDCANCANLVENALRKEPGVKDCVINFMAQKMKVEFEDDADLDVIKDRMLKAARKIEPDFEIE